MGGFTASWQTGTKGRQKFRSGAKSPEISPKFVFVCFTVWHCAVVRISGDGSCVDETLTHPMTPEVAFVSLAISALFLTLLKVSAKDERSIDVSELVDQTDHQFGELLEKQFGGMARKLLAKRYRRPKLVYSRP